MLLMVCIDNGGEQTLAGGHHGSALRGQTCMHRHCRQVLVTIAVYIQYYSNDYLALAVCPLLQKKVSTTLCTLFYARVS